MSMELIVGGIAVAICAVAYLALRPRAKPAQQDFHCTRCKKSTPHTPRTIAAWRNKKTRFFCQACHAQWLQSNQLKQSNRGPNRRTVAANENGGCMGIVLIACAVPAGVLVAKLLA